MDVANLNRILEDTLLHIPIDILRGRDQINDFLPPPVLVPL